MLLQHTFLGGGCCDKCVYVEHMGCKIHVHMCVDTGNASTHETKRMFTVCGFVCRNEDFYAVKAAGRCPEFDVLVTNPPFSGDHLDRIFRFAVKSDK